MAEARKLFETLLDQWKTGRSAELRLFCESGRLKVNMHADLGPWRAHSDGLSPNMSCFGGLQKASPSRQRRRVRRAAERVASAECAVIESDAVVKAAAENAIAKKIAENSSAVEKDLVKSLIVNKAAEESAAAVKAGVKYVKKTAGKSADAKTEECPVAEQAAGAEKSSVKEVSDSVATTSCLHSKVQCWNCNMDMTPAHQCELPASVVVEHPPPLPLCPVKPTPVAGSNPPPSMVEVSENVQKNEVAAGHLPPLPLCHYCCHLGSGDNPVHYFLQCLCADKVCNCQCYCSDVQLMHKKKFFPGGFTGSLLPVSPGDRPRAKAIAEARANKLDFRGVPMASRPCDNENCL